MSIHISLGLNKARQEHILSQRPQNTVPCGCWTTHTRSSSIVSTLGWSVTSPASAESALRWKRSYREIKKTLNCLSKERKAYEERNLRMFLSKRWQYKGQGLQTSPHIFFCNYLLYHVTITYGLKMLDTNCAALYQSHWELREDWVHFDENKVFLMHTDTFCSGIPTNLMFLKSWRLKLQMSPSCFLERAWWLTADHQVDLWVHLLFVFWPLSLWASLKSFSQPCCACKCDKTECVSTVPLR